MTSESPEPAGMSEFTPEPGATHWRSLDAEALTVAYSPSACLDGSIDPFIEAYVDRSAEARRRFVDEGRPIHVIRYGPKAAQTVDLVVPDLAGADRAERAVPMVVFIHGGYWQQLSKRESLFAAPECIDAGAAFAAVDYTLAPHASLDEIVSECRAALAALVSAAPEQGIDPNQIVVTGSSAGGHLAAMIGANHDWRPAATVLVSGVFDLEPLIATSINDAVGLDLASARRNSPALADLTDFPPTLIAHGDNEPAEFKRQSNDFAALLQGAGSEVTVIEISDRNHFDVILDLCDPSTSLGLGTLSFLT